MMTPEQRAEQAYKAYTRGLWKGSTKSIGNVRACFIKAVSAAIREHEEESREDERERVLGLKTS